MRDPNRIDVFCTRLAEHWKKVPDWRFGQLIDNVLDVPHFDPFYLEDDRVMQAFDRFFTPTSSPETGL